MPLREPLGRCWKCPGTCARFNYEQGEHPGACNCGHFDDAHRVMTAEEIAWACLLQLEANWGGHGFDRVRWTVTGHQPPQVEVLDPYGGSGTIGPAYVRARIGLPVAMSIAEIQRRFGSFHRELAERAIRRYSCTCPAVLERARAGGVKAVAAGPCAVHGFGAIMSS